MKALIKSLLPEKVQGPLKEAGYRAISFAYAGSRFTCPFCGRGFRKMLPRGLDHGVLQELHVVGGGWRPDAFCPGCLSYDRERLVFLYLRERTSLFRKPASMLHIAPERQLEKVFRALPDLKYTTGDLLSTVVDAKVDVTAIAFPDCTFDYVLCNHVLEHVPPDRLAMSEMLRVLKPGGLAIIQTPISTVLTATLEDPTVQTEADRCRVFGQRDHCRIYARDYADRLSGSGFNVEVFRWTDHPTTFGGDGNRFALNPEESVYACRKPGVIADAV